MDVADGGDVAVNVNGAPLPASDVVDEWMTSPIPPAAVKAGVNVFEVTLSDQAKKPASLQDLLLWVRSQKKR
jgi:hypothetical protein